MLICYERKVLVAGGWFVLREKYCWLVADNPNEQAESRCVAVSSRSWRRGPWLERLQLLGMVDNVEVHAWTAPSLVLRYTMASGFQGTRDSDVVYWRWNSKSLVMWALKVHSTSGVKAHAWAKGDSGLPLYLLRLLFFSSLPPPSFHSYRWRRWRI
jgi:hypothetical protein